MTLCGVAHHGALLATLLHDRELLRRRPATTTLRTSEYISSPRRHGLRVISIHITYVITIRAHRAGLSRIKTKDGRWGRAITRTAELVEASIAETFGYYAFPEEHWRRIRTNNPLERILREIRRRTRVVGAFPDGQSELNLAAARLRHVAGTEWSTKRYLSMDLLKDHQSTNATA